MGVLIGPIEFEGPFSDFTELQEAAGIYAILTERNGEFELLEMEESFSVKDCVHTDEFTSNLRFFQETSGPLLAVVHYTPDLNSEERRRVRLELLKEFE